MPQWGVVTTLIAVYLALTLWVGLRAGRGTSGTVDGFVAGDLGTLKGKVFLDNASHGLWGGMRR